MGRAGASLPFVACLALAQAVGPATAQIATDGTANRGFRGPVPFDGSNYDIRAELGRRAGDNLFHSFERFSLRNGESATFTGPAGIDNVISRVTGGEVSTIDGELASTIPGADFFFLNPAGVVFGPEASLNIDGSFHVSTADELRFSDGARFSATNPDANSFSVAAPEAFGFLGADPAPITVRGGFLRLLPGEALSIVGGDVDVSSNITRAEAGQINLAAVGGPGEARLANGDVVADRRADITLSDQSGVSTTGDGGGTIRIRAGRFVLTGESSLSANNNASSNSRGGVDIDARSVEVTGGGFINASSFGSGNAGNVTVGAVQMTIDGAGGGFTGIASDVGRRDVQATGRGGMVTVSTASLELLNGAEIRSSTFGSGAAGLVEVHATRLLISGEGLKAFEPLTGIASQVEAGASGEGGAVSVTADDLELRADGKIRSVTLSQGNAGTVTVTADRVTLVGGGQISSSTLDEGTGRSGNVVLTAHDTLSISGQSRFFDEDGGVFPPSGVFASTQSRRQDARAGGTVTVTSPVIRLADRGEIAAESFGGGAGGNVRVTTESLVIDDAEITTKAESSGAGGGITVRAGALELRNNGLITTLSSSNAPDAGAAGAITITADVLRLRDAARISGQSAAAEAGDIEISAGELVEVRESAITTSVAGGQGSGGNIFIDPEFAVLDSGRIVAQAREGDGGNIRIVADSFFTTPGTVIDASSDLGIDGTVEIDAPDVDLTSELAVLSTAFIDVSGLLRESCAARASDQTSSFVSGGSQGLAPDPAAPLAGTYATRTAREAGFQRWTSAQVSDCHD